MMDAVPDPLSFAGTMYVLRFHWFWMLVSLGLGCWVGWRMAGERVLASKPPGETPP